MNDNEKVVDMLYSELALEQIDVLTNLCGWRYLQ